MEAPRCRASSIGGGLVRHGGHRLEEREASGLARGAPPTRAGACDPECQTRDRAPGRRGEPMKLLRRRPPCSLRVVSARRMTPGPPLQSLRDGNRRSSWGTDGPWREWTVLLGN